jgi:hypothetical protein
MSVNIVIHFYCVNKGAAAPAADRATVLAASAEAAIR